MQKPAKMGSVIFAANSNWAKMDLKKVLVDANMTDYDKSD